jgi:hypothetical protein
VKQKNIQTCAPTRVRIFLGVLILILIRQGASPLFDEAKFDSLALLLQQARLPMRTHACDFQSLVAFVFSHHYSYLLILVFFWSPPGTHNLTGGNRGHPSACHSCGFLGVLHEVINGQGKSNVSNHRSSNFFGVTDAAFSSHMRCVSHREAKVSITPCNYIISAYEKMFLSGKQD